MTAIFQSKIVFMLRNPKSVAVSGYHHLANIAGYEYSGNFAGYLPGFMKQIGEKLEVL